MARKALKTILSLVMVVSMLVSISCVTAFANPAPDMVQNFEDTYYHQDGSAASASDWEVHLSKSAAVTDIENVFDITLLVETKDTSIELAGSTHGAVVLVLDASNSMEESAKAATAAVRTSIMPITRAAALSAPIRAAIPTREVKWAAEAAQIAAIPTAGTCRVSPPAPSRSLPPTWRSSRAL